MVVVRFAAGLVARAALAEIVALDDARVLEQPHRAVDGGDGNAVVDFGAAAVQFLDIRMVFRAREHARDNAPLFGHAHALGDAKSFDVSAFGEVFFRGIQSYRSLSY